MAGRLLRRVRDIAAVEAAGTVTAEVADAALHRLEVDMIGLDQMDRRYLSCLATTHMLVGRLGWKPLLRFV